MATPTTIILTIPSRTPVEFDRLAELGGGRDKLLTSKPIGIEVKAKTPVQIGKNSFVLMREHEEVDAEGEAFDPCINLPKGSTVFMSNGKSVTLDEDTTVELLENITISIPNGTKLQQLGSSAKMTLNEDCEGVITRSRPISRRTVMFCAVGNTIVVFDPDSNQIVARLTGHHNDIKCCCLSNSSAYLASIDGKQVIIWDAATYEKLYEHNTGAISISSSTDADAFITSAANQNMFLIDKNSRTMNAFGYSQVQTAPNGKFLVGLSGGKIHFMAPDGAIVRVYTVGDQAISLCISPDSTLIAIGFSNGKVQVMKEGNGATVALLGKEDYNDANAGSLCFSPDGKRIVVGYWFRSSANYIQVFDVETGQMLVDLVAGSSGSIVRAHNHYVHGVRYTADGKRIVSCGADKKIIVWDAETGRKLTELDAGAVGRCIC